MTGAQCKHSDLQIFQSGPIDLEVNWRVTAKIQRDEKQWVAVCQVFRVKPEVVSCCRVQIDGGCKSSVLSFSSVFGLHRLLSSVAAPLQQLG